MTHKAYKHLTRSIAWFMVFWLSVGWHWSAFFPIQTAKATGEKMILLWDTALGGTVPTGWTNASATYGGFFLRGDTIANVGTTASPTHSHTQNTVAFVDASTPTTTARVNNPQVSFTNTPHGHAVSTFSMDTSSILPTYRNLIAITYNSGIPTTIPRYAIALFDSAPGAIAGWTGYSSQNGNMIRIDSTSGGTGGGTTHTHANLSITSGISNSNVDGNAASTISPADGNHTHTYGPTTSPVSSDHTPLHTETILGYPDSADVAIPSGMIAMFDGDPNIDSSGWSVLSGAGGAFNGVYIEAQSAYQTGQGSATHNHALSVTSSTYTAGPIADNKGAQSAMMSSHSHTISGDFSSENNTPPYKNVVVAEKATALSVTAPADITLTAGNPSQTKDTTFGIGNEVTVTDGGSGWTLSVIMQSILTSGGNTIPNANVKIRKDGVAGGGSDIFTIWGGTYTNVSETDATESLDVTRTVGVRSSGSGGDSTTVRPSIQLSIPPLQATGDYAGTLRFTVV